MAASAPPTEEELKEVFNTFSNGEETMDAEGLMDVMISQCVRARVRWAPQLMPLCALAPAPPAPRAPGPSALWWKLCPCAEYCVRCSLGMNPKTTASKENVQKIFEEVAPSGKLDLASFSNIVSGKRDFPDTKEEVIAAFEQMLSLIHI